MTATSFQYDVFISYRHEDPDQIFAYDLMRQLETDGYKVALDGHSFMGDRPILLELERCIVASRFTLAIISHRYFKSVNTTKEARLRAILDSSDRTFCLVPVVIELVERPTWMYELVPVDYVNPNPLTTPYEQLKKVLGNPQASSSLSGTTTGRLLGNAPPTNPIFTGRQKELADLHRALQNGNAGLTPTPTAIRGMGGVGKAQSARRYVEEHQSDYAVICWVSGETPEDFITQMVGIANRLSSDLRQKTDQNAQFQAMKHWFDVKGGWLLVVDNAEKLVELRALLPSHETGRILLTTRELVPPTIGTAIEIRHFDDDMGATLLLRRAGLLTAEQTLQAADPQTQQDAKAVSADLGGLALALDQAGAYMQARGVTAATYRKHYRERRQSLHPKGKNTDHVCASVTFSLAMEQVEQTEKVGLAAGQLIRMCAFLTPDSIPDEVFLQGNQALEPELAQYASNEIDFGKGIEAASKYALIRRETSPNDLWMHRLAQEVARDSLSEEAQKVFRQRAVLAVNAAFPNGELISWPLCERLLPHALLCASYLTDNALHTAEAVRLVDRTASYLRQRARYKEADRLYRQALAIRKQVYGAEHPDVAASLNNLGDLLIFMGRFVEAASCLEEAVWINLKTIGESHPTHVIYLDNLACAYYYQQRYEKVLPLIEQAIAITKRHLGAEHPRVAIRLNNLAIVYAVVGRYAEAMGLLKEALAIDRKTIGEHDPVYADHSYNLARIYVKWDLLDKAEPPLKQVLSLRERLLGLEQTEIAYCHSVMGDLRYQQGRLVEAADCYRLALAIWETTKGLQHFDTMYARKRLAEVEAELK